MSTCIAVFAFATALISQGPTHVQDAKVHGGVVNGVLLLTADTALQGKLRKEFVPGVKLTELQDRFSNPSWRWFTWGQRSAILIDLNHPFFDQVKATNACLGVMEKTIQPDGTLDLRRSSDEDRAAVWTFLRRTYPQLPPTPPPADGWPTLGLRAQTRIELDSDTRSARVELLEPDAFAKPRNEALRGNLFTALASRLTPEDRERLALEVQQRLRHRQALGTHWIGHADQHIPEGFRELSLRLTEVTDEFAKEGLAAAIRIGVKLGLKSNLPVTGSPADLNEALRDQIRDRLIAEKLSNRFADGLESAAFFDSITGFRSSTVLALAFAVRAGTNGQGNSYHSIELGSYPGGVGP